MNIGLIDLLIFDLSLFGHVESALVIFQYNDLADWGPDKMAIVDYILNSYPFVNIFLFSLKLQ